MLFVIFCDFDETGSSATVLNYFHIMYQSISSSEHPFFLFLETSLSINLISPSFDLFEPCTTLNLLLSTLNLISEFLFFCTFWDAVNAGYRE